MKLSIAAFLAVFIAVFAIRMIGGKDVSDELLTQCNNASLDISIGESSIDCGGQCGTLPVPNLCNAGQHCNDNKDCNFSLSLSCKDGVCQ